MHGWVRMSFNASKIEKIFLAFADITRLRLINLMRGGEVCVNELESVLVESQPKISRHLAYLRSCGVVTTRRDGRHIYYSIEWPDDTSASDVINSTLRWMENNAEMQREFRRLRTRSDSLEAPKFAETKQPKLRKTKRVEPTASAVIDIIRPPDIIEEEPLIEEYQPTFFHNEIDDFLL